MHALVIYSSEMMIWNDLILYYTAHITEQIQKQASRPMVSNYYTIWPICHMYARGLHSIRCLESLRYC
jgi:hypothetical protein